MAMRLLVSICCIVTSSATGVWSESQFKSKYDAYVIDMDSAQVKIANANIVGKAIPADAEEEREMHRWYQDVNAAVQADAKAIMDKTVADRLAPGNYATGDCMAKISTAIGTKGDTWGHLYPIYLSVSGDVVQADADAAAATTAAVGKADGSDEVKAKKAAAAAAAACHCVHALSGAEKDLAIKAGFHSKLFGFFKTKMNAALTGTLTMAKVSTFVTGTLAAVAPDETAEGKDTQPMYSTADTTLRGSMMHAMVSKLNGQLPVV